MKTVLDGKTLELSAGATYADAAAVLYPDNPRRGTGGAGGRAYAPLTAPVQEGGQAKSLTLQTEEGRRIYERSLRFVLLLAVRETYPSAKVRIENSTKWGCT